MRPDHRLRSFGVFLGWMVVAVIAYAAWYATASDVPPWGCHDLTACTTERDEVLFLGWFLVAPCLLVQLAIGLVVNARFSKQLWGAFATGTAAFFTTAPVPAFVLLAVVYQ